MECLFVCVLGMLTFFCYLVVGALVLCCTEQARERKNKNEEQHKAHFVEEAKNIGLRNRAQRRSVH